jgi:hypothetical protein
MSKIISTYRSSQGILCDVYSDNPKSATSTNKKQKVAVSKWQPLFVVCMSSPEIAIHKKVSYAKK